MRSVSSDLLLTGGLEAVPCEFPLTNDYGHYPPGRGHAWRGDWKVRLEELVRARGFDTVTAFADSRPATDLPDLVRELGPGDVAAIQLQWALVEEAQAQHTLQRCARDLLARRLSALAEGWPGAATGRSHEKSWPAIKALSSWASAFAKVARGLVGEISDVILMADDIPEGWMPTGPDDPVIVAVFEGIWSNEKL